MTAKKPDYKDIAIAYLTGGEDALRTAKDSGASPKTFKRAADHLLSIGAEPERVDALRLWMASNGIRSAQGRGSPCIGEYRKYKNQDIGEGPFLRVPIDVLGGAKGEESMVKFEADAIIIRRA